HHEEHVLVHVHQVHLRRLERLGRVHDAGEGGGPRERVAIGRTRRRERGRAVDATEAEQDHDGDEEVSLAHGELLLSEAGWPDSTARLEPCQRNPSVLMTGHVVAAARRASRSPARMASPLRLISISATWASYTSPGTRPAGALRHRRARQSVGNIKAHIGAWTLPPGEVLMTRPRYSAFAPSMLSMLRDVAALVRGVAVG